MRSFNQEEAHAIDRAHGDEVFQESGSTHGADAGVESAEVLIILHIQMEYGLTHKSQDSA